MREHEAAGVLQHLILVGSMGNIQCEQWWSVKQSEKRASSLLSGPSVVIRQNS